MMSNETKIEWCDSTLNLQMGCAGCELWNPAAGNLACYAGVLTRKYAGMKGWPKQFEKPVVFPDRLQSAIDWPDLRGTVRFGKPWLNGLPRIIFLNDMGDTFTEGLDPDWLAPFLPVMEKSPHQFLVLTKRAQKFAEFSERHPLPSNVWPGVSVTSERTTGRLAFLERIKSGGPKWCSLEPILTAVELAGICPSLQWLIIGGLSGTNRPTDIAWIRSAAQLPGPAIFVKQLGSIVHEPYYMEDDLRREWLIDRVDRKEGRIMVPGGKPGYFVEWEHRTHGQPAPGSVFEWRAKDKGGDLSQWPEDLRIRTMPIEPVAKVESKLKGELF